MATKSKLALNLRKPPKIVKPVGITTVPAIKVVQQGREFFVFAMSAVQLELLTEINRREEGKQEGYQRVLSPSRHRAITKYIQGGGIIPGSIIVSLDSASYDDATGILSIVGTEKAGWVIDGQHRLVGAVGASDATKNVELAVVGFPNIDEQDQIELFITINREAKGVPASLYLDLLKDLPRKKSDRELLDEKITDIARSLNTDENGPFYQRLIFTRTASAGEISVVNFARILRPILTRQSGVLGLFTLPEQEGAISNYYKALKMSFPGADAKGIFYRTIGFGAVWKAFPFVLNLTQTQFKSFNVASIVKIFKEIEGFNFDDWTRIGTGTQAEIQAGDDLVSTLEDAFRNDKSPTISLKLD